MRVYLTWCALTAIAATLLACGAEVDGPTPTIAGSGSQLPVDPGIACRAQLTTDVTVRGEQFSPIPIDIPKDPKVALPSITLRRSHLLDGRAGDDREVNYSGNPDNPVNLSLLSWQSQRKMTFTINQDVELDNGDSGEIAVGLYDITVKNPNDHEAQEPGAIAIVEKPEFASVTPSITCLAQEDRVIDISGTTFLEVNGAQPSLMVEDVPSPFAPSMLGDCTTIAHDGIDAKYCTTAQLTLAQGAIDVGYPALTVQNPDPAACVSEEAINLRVAPPPTIDRVVDPLACVAQEDRAFTIEGSDFLQIDAVNPTVTIGGEAFAVDEVGDCDDLPTMGHAVKSCHALSITVPKDALMAGNPEIVVLNPDPAGCSASNSVALTIVPPPTVTEVVPPLVCVDDGTRVVEILGTDFLTVDGEVPTVAFDGTAVPADAVSVDAADCETLDVQGLTVEKCSKLTVSIDQGGLDIGAPDVMVTNPDPAGCSDTQSNLLTVVNGPKVTSATPALVCTDDGDRLIELGGADLLKVGGDLPKVTLDGVLVNSDSIGDCTDVMVNGLAVQSCSTLTISVPQGTLMEGDTEITIENPDPAGCVISNTTVLTVPPEITIASAVPTNACENTGAYDVTVTGTGFLRVDGTDFTVQVAGNDVVATAITGCTDLDVDGQTVQSCTEFQISIDSDTVAAGDVEISVTNPDPASSGCAATDSGLFRIVAPPTVTDVQPDEVCSDTATTLTITGTNFAAGTTVTAGTTAADSVDVTSDTQLTATFDNGLAAGTHDITVQTAPNCNSTATAALLVDPTPLVFFVDPPVLYNGISLEATVFVSGLTANAAKVELVDSNNVVTNIPDFDSPQRPGKIQAQIPAGLPADDYEVRITSQLNCVGGLPGAVTITDSLTLTVTSIDPSYVSPSESTAVTITGTGFTDTPRVYLNPVGGGVAADAGAADAGADGGGAAGPSALALHSVVWDNATQLTGVIPANTAPGDYDLIVVNPKPGAEVGLLANAVHVTQGEPPEITAVVPNSVSSSTDTEVTLLGANFDAAGVTVGVTCKDTVGAISTGAGSNINNLTTTSVKVTLPSAGLANGTVCLVTLTNTDGSFFTYSAVSIKNPSANLFPWTASTTTLLEGRRGLSLLAGRPTNTSRFLYAIGGDDGTVAGAKDTIEAVATDVFGTLGNAFSYQRNSLPEARTLAGSARIGRFLYLAGGHNGTSATNTLVRTQILDPLAGPEIVDLDAALGDGTNGLDQGLYYYMVAATFPSSDLNNPGGESLAGESFPVQLPSNPNLITLTLDWAEVAGASGYKLYRSPLPGDPAASADLLATITCGDQVCVCGVDIQCSYTDQGTATQTGETPLPTGSLGTWHELTGSTLNTSREGLATVAVQKPGAANDWFLYAFGGRDGAGTYLSSYEWASVTINGDGTQTVSDWSTGDRNIGTAKADLAAWTVTNSDSSLIASTDAYVFVGTGRTDATSTAAEVRSGHISSTSTDGNLITTGVTSLDAENGLSGQGQAASSFGAASGFLYLFGGEAGNQNLIATDSSGPLSAGPNLPVSWTSQGAGSLATERALASAAQESAFFYIAGGRTAASAATTSVERTVQ